MPKVTQSLWGRGWGYSRAHCQRAAMTGLTWYRQGIRLLFLTVLAATLSSSNFSPLSLWLSLFHHRSPGWSVRLQWGSWVRTEGMQVLEEAGLLDRVCVYCWRPHWCWHTGLFLPWYYPGVQLKARLNMLWDLKLWILPRGDFRFCFSVWKVRSFTAPTNLHRDASQTTSQVAQD